MKFIIFFTFWVVLTLKLSAREELPNIKFIDTYCDYKLSIPSYLFQIGDTLVFSSVENDTNFIYLANKNQCTRLSVYEFGNPDPKFHSVEFALNGAEKDNFGNIWFATNWGLAKYDGISISMENSFQNGSDSIIYALIKSPIGIIYAFSNGEIIMINENTFTIYNSTDDPYLLPFPNRGNSFVVLDNKIYFKNFKFDLGYFNLIDNKFYNNDLIGMLERNGMEKNDNSRSFRLNNKFAKIGNQLLFTVGNLAKNPFVIYDGKILNYDYTLWDSNFTDIRYHDISFISGDSKNRKWLSVNYYDSFGSTADLNEYLVIDSNNKIFRIPIDNYGEVGVTNSLFGIAELRNGIIYATFRFFGFIVEDPAGVSVEENESKEPSFFMEKVRPNPFKDYTKIDILATQSAIDNMEVEIIDYLGKTIKKVLPFIEYQPANGKATLEIETTGISPGYYYMILRDGNNVRSKPIIIK